MNEVERIQEKLRRLIALRDHPNTNVHEAAEAAAKIQELLFKFNMAEQDVPERERKLGYVRVKLDLGEGKAVAWKRDLSFPVAKYNFCRAYFAHNVDSRGRLHRVNHMILIGEPHNIEIVKYLMEYLSAEIIRLADRFYDSEGRGPRVSWKTQFCYGAVQGVAEVLKEQFEKNRQAEVKSTALVVVKDKELMEAQNRLVGPVNTMNLSGAKAADSYDVGKEKGREISIKKPISGSSKPILLG